MLFKITDVEFDFDDDVEFTQYHYDNVTADTLDSIWEAVDGDDLIEEVTNLMGWCIKSIAYEVVDQPIEYEVV